MKNPLRGYDPIRPLKDNLAQVKNFIEALVAVVIASAISTLPQDISPEVVALVNMVEAGVVYYLISALEYAVKDKGDGKHR